jgi:hypothetical protein
MHHLLVQIPATREVIKNLGLCFLNLKTHFHLKLSNKHPKNLSKPISTFLN